MYKSNKPKTFLPNKMPLDYTELTSRRKSASRVRRRRKARQSFMRTEVSCIPGTPSWISTAIKTPTFRQHLEYSIAAFKIDVRKLKVADIYLHITNSSFYTST